MKRMAVALAVLAVLVGLCVTPVHAQEVPPLPHAFYGTVEINDSPAPVGTQVEARGKEVLFPIEVNPIVTTEAGKYGDAGPLEPKLIVQGFILEGTTLTFYVNGVLANETAEWHSGEVTELDLTVTMPTVPPTVTTDPATGVTRTAATLNGTLTDLGSASLAEVSFEWGTTTSYGNETATQTMTSTGSFSSSLSDLSTNTTYHFRAKAVGEGTSYGIDKTFTTRAPAGGGGIGAADTTPPRISNISLCPEGVTETTADICWETNEKSTSQVEYWTSPSTLSPLDETYVIKHHVKLTGLTPGTTYHYKTMSMDRSDNLAVSDEYTFSTLGKAPAAAFAIKDLSVSPSEVEIGETVTISILVTNSGDLAGSYKATLKINGAVEETKEVKLNAGASREVTFTTAKDKAASYSVDVNGLTGSFIVKEKPAPPAPPPEEAPPAKPINWPVIGGIIAGVVVVGLLIFFLVRRRTAY